MRMSVAERLEVMIMAHVTTVETAKLICIEHLELTDTDYTENGLGNTTHIYTFSDDSVLKIGTDFSIFHNATDEAQYFKRGK